MASRVYIADDDDRPFLCYGRVVLPAHDERRIDRIHEQYESVRENAQDLARALEEWAEAFRWEPD